MSILHHLTLALRRLDPDNRLWAELQKERALEESGTAYEAATQQERDERLAEISETFERYRDSDFGRKLYLIQNSIYGVTSRPSQFRLPSYVFSSPSLSSRNLAMTNLTLVSNLCPT